VKPYSSRRRSKIRFAVCCCFLGRDLSSKRNPVDHRNERIKLRLGRRLCAHVTRRRREPHHLGDRARVDSKPSRPPRDGSTPRSEPRSERAHKAPRPSSPALCRPNAKGYLLPDFCSGAPGISGRFNEGLLLRRLHLGFWLHALNSSGDRQSFSPNAASVLRRP